MDVFAELQESPQEHARLFDRTIKGHLEHIEHVVKGECFGLALCREQYGDDPPSDQLAFHWLVHDDGNWFVAGSGYSSFWLDDVEDVLDEVLDWLDTHAVRVDDRGGRYYRLKGGEEG